MNPESARTTDYAPDYRLGDSYEQASRIDAAGLEALCPSYLEITANEPRYLGEELLGRGATKEVFRTFDTHTKRWIALARLVQLDLHCLMLDFQAVLASPPLSNKHPFPDFRPIAELAPDFAFSRALRPTAGQLAGFLRAAVSQRPKLDPMIERMVSYDSAARTDFTDYPEVVAALLAYANPGWTEDGFQYDPATKALTLNSAVGLRVVIPRAGGSGQCLLRFTPVYSLCAAIRGPVDLSGLDQQPLIVLDIRDCPQARFSRDISLPLLSELYVRGGTFDPDDLHRRIQSARTCRIIEDP